MEMGSIVDFLDNKTILVTGATGFLAKIFVEKILRTQPNVKKLYLLVRATNATSALQRFNTELVETELFKGLKEKYGANLQSFLSEKVTMVAGDIACENLGVQDPDLIEQMTREVDVVVNAAATINYNERYDVSLALNTYGAKLVLDFAKKCVNIKLLLHISTAYVSGEKAGLILETPYRLGETLNGVKGLDIKQEKIIIEDRLNMLKYDHDPNDKAVMYAMKSLGVQRANYYGWPNTYVFTKAMGEMILGHSKGDIPLVILRPTIITSTYKEPFPGWVEGVRSMDSFMVEYGKGTLTCFPGNPETVYDVVPADMVVNVMIAAIVAHANQTGSETIYHVGSSVSNPLKLTEISRCGITYFNRHPWIDNSGKPVVVGEITYLKSMDSFHRFISLRYRLPLQVLKSVNVIACQSFTKTCNKFERQINSVVRLVKLYEPFLFSKSFYDDMNAEKLRRAVRKSDNKEDIFFFDPKIIDWEDYLLHTHIPGVVKYERCLKKGPGKTH